MNLIDKDGYPLPYTIRKIEKWKIKDHKDNLALLNFVKTAWWMPDWGFTQTTDNVDIVYGNATCKVRHTFMLSTGGWSGNEDIIRALKRNFVFWSMTWQVHRVGGHYEFRVEELNFTK